MAIIYQQGANDDLAPLASVGIDDDSATAWWGGAQKCFASIALATVLAVTALATDVAQQVQQQGDQSDVPAGKLLNVKIDDDSATAWWAGVQGCFASIHANAVQSATALSTDLAEYEEQGEQSDVPAGTLHGQPEEYLWQNSVAPVPASLWQLLPYGLDAGEIVPAAPTFQPEEDLWQNSVAPVAASLFQQLPLDDPEEIPAGSLYGQPDEDFWQNLVAAVPASLFQVLPYSFDAVEIVPQPAAPIPDEDFWQNSVLPVQASIFRSPLFEDLEEIPAGSLFGQDDEDFWQNPVLPVATSLYQRLPIGDPEEIPAASLFGQYDEDFWRNAVAPVPAANAWPQQFSFDVQEPAGAFSGQTDEDFWQNPVRPVPASLYRSPLLGDQEEIPGALASANPDEDYWINAVRPVAAGLYQNLPYLYESADFLLAQPPVEDEDFWQNRVAPVAASLYRSPLFTDPEELPAGFLAKFPSAEEEYWQNRVAPVTSSLYQRLPFGSLNDQEEVPAGSLAGQMDEDFWQNPVAPVLASIYRTPLFRDPEELPGSLVKAKPDEDYWQNRTAPVAAVLYQPLPYLYDAFDSDSVVATPATAQLGGGIAWPYPELSERHWSAPPSSTLPIKKGKQKKVSIAGTATPAGLSAQVTLGTVVTSGSARTKAEGQKATATRGSIQIAVAATLEPSSESHRVHRYGMAGMGRVRARGIRNPSDEELLLILGEIE